MWTDFLYLLFEFPGAGEPEIRGCEIAAFAEPVRLIYVHDAGQGALGTKLLVHRLHAAERSAGNGTTVVSIPPRDNDVPLGLIQQLPVAAHETQKCVVRLAAGARVEDVIELRRRDFLQDSRELDGGRRRALEEAVVVRQLQHLPVGSV